MQTGSSLQINVECRLRSFTAEPHLTGRRLGCRRGMDVSTVTPTNLVCKEVGILQVKRPTSTLLLREEGRQDVLRGRRSAVGGAHKRAKALC